jgi:hypothetical protein
MRMPVCEGKQHRASRFAEAKRTGNFRRARSRGEEQVRLRQQGTTSPSGLCAAVETAAYKARPRNRLFRLASFFRPYFSFFCSFFTAGCESLAGKSLAALEKHAPESD